METDPSKPPNPPQAAVVDAVPCVPDIDSTLRAAATRRFEAILLLKATHHE